MEKGMEKVFCNKCRHYHRCSFWNDFAETCSHPKNIVIRDFYNKQIKGYAESPRERNRINTCKLFEEKIKFKLLGSKRSGQPIKEVK